MPDCLELAGDEDFSHRCGGGGGGAAFNFACNNGAYLHHDDSSTSAPPTTTYGLGNANRAIWRDVAGAENKPEVVYDSSLSAVTATETAAAEETAPSKTKQSDGGINITSGVGESGGAATIIPKPAHWGDMSRSAKKRWLREHKRHLENAA
jgi:hypothetical protein